MLKLFLFFFIISSYVIYASDKVEIYADQIDSHDDIIIATGGISVVYQHYLLSANRAKYNKKTGDLELFDNIKVTHDTYYRVIGNYAKLNLAKKERVFKPFYMLDKPSDVWISGLEGNAKDKDIDVVSGIVSGCDQNDPLWKMQFTSSDYNSDTKWLNLYNTTLYLYDIPVLYMPYFGYSLDKKRRTGLLMPSLGYSEAEGLYYQQPLYIAEQNWWDLEIRPQVRTNRGSGVYSDFRFVDSAISSGEFSLGYFKEYGKYFEENNLENNSHYGFNFKYDNRDVINHWFRTNYEGQSGLYVDLNNMNDVDYINLRTNNNLDTNTATQVLSRVNLFYNTDDDYIAAYFKYYQDLTLPNNGETLQKLPTLHYHSYLDTLLSNHLFYNLDVKSTNITRVTNETALQTDLNLPVTLQTDIFDEYLRISYNTNLYGQSSNFNFNQPSKYNDGYFIRNYHTFKASMDLTKAFNEVTHVIELSSTYTHGGYESRDGFYEDNQEFCEKPENQNSSQCEFYNITNIDDTLELGFTQYLYDISGKEIIYHRLAQNIYYAQNQSQYGELENELKYKISNWFSIYNNMFYNFDEKKFSKVFNKLSFKTSGFKVSLSHLYKNTFLESTSTYSPHTSYLTSTARYTYNEHYSYNIRYDFDIETSIKKSAEIGFLYKKRCWNFGIRYVENNRPVLTQSGESSVYDKYIYFTIVLKPLMSSKVGDSDFGFKLPDS
jgi:LPS-assembly protein